jgi:hypothetical protein
MSDTSLPSPCVLSWKDTLLRMDRDGDDPLVLRAKASSTARQRTIRWFLMLIPFYAVYIWIISAFFGVGPFYTKTVAYCNTWQEKEYEKKCEKQYERMLNMLNRIQWDDMSYILETVTSAMRRPSSWGPRKVPKTSVAETAEARKSDQQSALKHRNTNAIQRATNGFPEMRYYSLYEEKYRKTLINKSLRK